MSYEAVDIYIKDRAPLGNVLSGVVVKVMTEDGRMVFGQAQTDSTGKASFLLPNRKYQLRFFKFGVNFKNPLFIDVLEGQNNAFNVYGEPYVVGQSTDTRICIASGFFRTSSGAPHRAFDMHFIPKFDPIILDDAGVLHERVTARTNDKGFASVPLIRLAQYDVTLEGFENIYRSIEVPDAPAVNLPDLLFPVIKGITFDVSIPLELSVGEEIEVPTHVFTTDLRELEELGSDVLWSVSNPQVLNFEINGSNIKLRGLNPGSAEVRADRKDKTVIRIPNTPISGVPLSVTVA